MNDTVSDEIALLSFAQAAARAKTAVAEELAAKRAADYVLSAVASAVAILQMVRTTDAETVNRARLVVGRLRLAVDALPSTSGSQTADRIASMIDAGAFVYALAETEKFRTALSKHFYPR